MKAQFLLISAVVAGGIMIGIFGVVSDAKEEDYSPGPRLAYQIDSIEDEAEKVDTSDPEDRRRFRRAVGRLGYSSSVDLWVSQNCFNVSLRSESRSATVNCVG
nr:MAG: hypothetical protein J07AB56_08500 [Candidatus Nanosalinarum sp. J07AB56]